MKKILFIFITICLISCDDPITWKLSESGTLTISGRDMSDYSNPECLFDIAPWYSQREKIKEIVIEDGVTSIGDNAFNGCSRLREITIPESVKSIGDNAFKDCSRLTQITIPGSDYSNDNIIPKSVKSIGDGAFKNCSSIKDVDIKAVKTIGNGAFAGCSRLREIYIPESVRSIGAEAFKDCYSLESIKTRLLEDGGYYYYDKFDVPISYIGGGTFKNCVNLTTINIPESVTEIGFNAFEGCSGLTSINIP